MNERSALHEKFLYFFQVLEEQAELSRKPNSKQFKELAESLEISPKTLIAYLRSEHYITFLEAFKFCKKYGLNTEELFSHVPNYIQRISEENKLSILPGFSAIAGTTAPASLSQTVSFSKVKGTSGPTMRISVSGDSMTPDYNEGEQVLLKKLSSYADIKNNSTYVFALEDNSYKIKKVEKIHNEKGRLTGFILISNNKKYKKEPYTLDDILAVYSIIKKYPATENTVLNKSEKNREKLKNLIAQRSDVKKVLELLRKLYPKNNDIIVFQSQFNQNLRDYRKGEIEISSRDRSNARIITGILEIIDEMENKVLEKIEETFFE